MRFHSAITLRKLFTRKSLGIPKSLSITASPALINSLANVSGRIRTPSPYSRIFELPNAFFHGNQRRFGTDSSGGDLPPDINKVVDEINRKFAEVVEYMEMLKDAKDTVYYFNEEAEGTRTAAMEVVEMFNCLLRKATEKERATLQRSMGLKIEHLKAEIEQLDDCE